MGCYSPTVLLLVLIHSFFAAPLSLSLSYAQPHKTFSSHNQTLSLSLCTTLQASQFPRLCEFGRRRLPLPFSQLNPHSPNLAAACHSPAHLAITCSPSASALLSPLGVAVVGGGPAGTSAAKALAQVFLLERNPAGAKPCGGAIPLCMLDEFTIPP